ncbi:MAG: hypothetical protein RLZZ301_1292 [Bacteroidota bacterium]|jgi:short subunit dehydrogenase-like uncharacterized protein
MDQPTLFLVGAYGYTAKLIAEKLDAAKLPFVAVGKDPQRLAEVLQTYPSCQAYLQADCLVAEDLNFIKPHSIVLNCAGPFNQLAPALIDRCVEMGANYLDITGEQWIVKRSIERLSEQAITTQCCVVHSLAFESALVDLILAKMALKVGTAAIDAVFSYYDLKSHQMSPGTKLSMKLAPYAQNFVVTDQQLVPFEQQRAVIPTGMPFSEARIVPYPEVIFTHRRLKAREVASHFALSTDSPLNYAGNLQIKPTDQSQEQINQLVERFKRVQHSGPTAEERNGQAFEIFVHVRTAQHDYIERVRGVNMYEITAALMVLAVQKLIDNPTLVGVLSPAELLGEVGAVWLAANPFCHSGDSIERMR